MQTPFFPQWRGRLSVVQRRLLTVRQQSLTQLEVLFSPFLVPGLLSQTDEGPNSRERIYSVRRTFWGFLGQVLNPGCSCREVVRQIQALFALEGGRCVDEATGGWSQARGRLPADILPRLRCSAAASAQKPQSLWHGLRTKVIDATSTSLPDTPKNQRAYPQPSGQKPGCGFPIIKIVGVFCLASGALLDYAKGNQHQHELALLQKLLDQFKRGDLVLADRGFNSYALMAVLLLRGVESVFRLNAARPADLRRGKRLGRHDRLVVWAKPWGWQRPRFFPKALWARLPKQMTVRLVRFRLEVRGYRTRSVTLATTLLDPKAYPARELALLYARRWKIELWFRDLKTSMGMEVLRCKSPKMVHKELELYFIAYNLIRCLMVNASVINDMPLERISYKGTLDSVRQFSTAIAQARSRKQQKQLLEQLLESLARDQLPNRPGRREPRAIKRRQKPYPLLNCPRHLFREIPHQSRYRKKHSTNTCS